MASGLHRKEVREKCPGGFLPSLQAVSLSLYSRSKLRGSLQWPKKKKTKKRKKVVVKKSLSETKLGFKLPVLLMGNSERKLN